MSDDRPTNCVPDADHVPRKLAELPNWSTFTYERHGNAWTPRCDARTTYLTFAAAAEQARSWGKGKKGVCFLLPPGMAAIRLRKVDGEDCRQSAPWADKIVSAGENEGRYEEGAENGVDVTLLGRVSADVEGATGKHGHVEILGAGSFLPLGEGSSFGPYPEEGTEDYDADRLAPDVGSIDAAIALARKYLDKRVPPPIDGLVRLGSRAPKAPPAPLERLIPRRGIVRYFSPPGVGKTFVGTDQALHIAHGLPWLGYPVSACPVLYCLSESTAAFPVRLAAWAQAHPEVQLDRDMFAQYERPLDILDDGGKKLGELLEATEARVSYLDLWSDHFGTGDENSTAEMGRLVKILRQLAAKHDCSFVLVGHSGLSAQDRGRGSSVIRGAADVELQLAAVGKGGVITITCTKSRDSARELPFAVRLKPVTLEDGRTTCVVEAARLETSDEGQKAAIRALCAARGSDTLTRADVNAALGLVVTKERSAEAVRKASKRLTDTLEADGFITATGKNEWTLSEDAT